MWVNNREEKASTATIFLPVVLFCNISKLNLYYKQFEAKKLKIQDKIKVFLIFALTNFTKQVYNNSITEAFDIQISYRGER
ncbi:hypothetical protein GCM10010916_04190 [Paenibacillus abyssi]|uniref:Uncharacterized protein n=1 Tax=Paenibacillus abyssi TaxID=1340531 RepID=A0A917FLL0_9BACL|nr:hypothetical protein GCM10010916_04190 [Paenibacillus abyssi]